MGFLFTITKGRPHIAAGGQRSKNMTDNLVFFQSPRVTVATNTFINVPTILQYEENPLIQIIHEVEAGFTIQIPIYHSDGTYIAKAVGSRLFTTDKGGKAGLALRYEKDKTVCELNGKTVFEIQRHGAAALRIAAELYTPDGAFVTCSSDLLPKLFLEGSEKPLQIGGVIMSGNIFENLRIGIWLRKDGTIKIGVS